MTSIALFHSVLGARPGVNAAADLLRSHGHTVRVVDQYDGRVFDDYTEADKFATANRTPVSASLIATRTSRPGRSGSTFWIPPHASAISPARRKHPNGSAAVPCSLAFQHAVSFLIELDEVANGRMFTVFAPRLFQGGKPARFFLTQVQL